MTENYEQNVLIHLSAYVPNKLVKNDVKNSSSIFQRLFPFCFAIGLHCLFFYWLIEEFGLPKKYLPYEVITVLEFMQPTAKTMPVDVLPDMRIKKPASGNTVRVTVPSSAPSQPDLAENKNRENKQQPLRLYDDNGRVKLPVDFIENLDAANLPSKRFDFQNPDLELAGTFLKRPPLIDFNPTQFEQAWKPDQDILTELLEKAVEKTMKEIKIPVPGNPGVKLVCKVSVLALGGGCGFVPNGGYGRVIADDEDDPNTLSPEEDKQCQAWWEKINSTKSQREWLKTKELYEITCKKPLAKEKIKAPQGL